MQARIIQGFFTGGVMRPMPGVVRPAGPTGGGARPGAQALSGPPPSAFAGRPASLQLRGGAQPVQIDATRLGLARSGGKPLPTPLLAKMEAAFGADFSAVRVHIGPQAAQIGAIAFTTGNDLYFAPGRYQPESVQGQQLIGHELAHVIQQRQGRVRAPGSGVAVVQDHALEAEADRLGMRAAMYRAPVQAGIAAQAKPAFGHQHRTWPAPGTALQRSSTSTASTNTQSTSVTLTIGGLQYPGKTGKNKGHAEMQALDDFLEKIRGDMKSNSRFDSLTTSQLDAAVFEEAAGIISGGPNSVDCSSKPVCLACGTILKKLGFTADTGTTFGDKKSPTPDWNVSTRVRDFMKYLKLEATLNEAIEAGKSK